MPELQTEKDITTEAIGLFFQRLNNTPRQIGSVTKTGIKESSVSTYRSKLNKFFVWLIAKGEFKVNPFEGIPYPKPDYTELKFLSQGEIKRIVNSIVGHPWGNDFVQKRNLAMIYVLFGLGLRKSELINLEVRDVDIKTRDLTVRGETSKSKITRTIPINSEVWMYLTSYMHERQLKKYTTPYLFASNNSDRGITSDGVKHLLAKLIEISGVKFHLHRLRHTFGMNLAAHGAGIAKIQQMMGHKDIRQTQVYTKLIPTAEMRVDVEMGTLDKLVK
jgi:site-specific recombinase XerD